MKTDQPQKTNLGFELDTDSIDLFKLLKVTGLAGSGGMAKLLISDGQVSVNGELETRKRRKILVGDVVQFSGERVEIFRKEKQPGL